MLLGLRLRSYAAFRRRAGALPRDLSATAKKREYDVIIVGGGHNGLVSAAYLAKAGLSVAMFEARPLVGGAAVTEEIIPGYKFSRFSYLAGLLRRSIVEELKLHDHGLKYLLRSPSSWTPSLDPHGASLTLGGEDQKASICQFSEKDAAAYPEYELLLERCRELLEPLLESHPPLPLDQNATWSERLASTRVAAEVVKIGLFRRSESIMPLYELLTAPATTILDRYFESEVLKATLATDSIIGAMISPKLSGSGYVLLHHVMGQVEERAGVWAYVEGGMSGISESIASSARDHGAEIFTSTKIEKLLVDDNNTVTGVVTSDDGEIVARKAVLSNLDPFSTFAKSLLPENAVPPEFKMHVEAADYSCGAFKINLALSGLPNFACAPNADSGEAGPQHRGTIHFLAGPDRTMEELHVSYLEAASGKAATRPVVEMTIPSAVDPTLAPAGHHVCQLFVQYAPYEADWANPAFKADFVEKVLDVVETYAPGFKSLIVGEPDALSPLDLEQILGLHKGNICHLSLSLHQLAYARPVPGHSSHRTPLNGLYLCGAGTHPGGGVMGAPGRNCARVLLHDLGL